jgi:glucose-6-phosphate isomerase
LQQVMEGARDKFLWFLRVDANEAPGPQVERSLYDCQAIMQGRGMGELFGAMATATRSALETQGVQSLTLQAERLDEASVGALFMLSELVVGALGEALDIDAFNQPGVELGKRLAREILSSRAR